MPTPPTGQPSPPDQPPLELWGGMECTVNRVRNAFLDQFQFSGHLHRITPDLERFAALGLRTLRYPLHWERFVATGSWQPFDDALTTMQRVGINPIAGLVHHGSGPLGTSLLDPGFAPNLAAYALTVAQRYPWLDRYTPVNEPQTTARFSGLYGHWYPHHRSIPSYVGALVHQVKATVLSMQAIRSVNPRAQLVTTEDGGKTWSTPQLEPDRLMREHRRWLGLDLLCGRVDRHHPLFAYLLGNGIPEPDVLWFADNPCPPDTIGLNYYLTSDRFLDHRTDLYPPGYVGGDTGHEPFVDVEALRVHPSGIAGAQTILTEAWQRYRIPVAITEAHIAGTVEDQILWLSEIWQAAQQARAAGIHVAAVTVWALLGSFNWCHLVTRDTGDYEPGVFTLASPTADPVPTALATCVHQLATGQARVPQTPGWWSHPDRLTFPPHTPETEAADTTADPTQSPQLR